MTSDAQTMSQIIRSFFSHLPIVVPVPVSVPVPIAAEDKLRNYHIMFALTYEMDMNGWLAQQQEIWVLYVMYVGHPESTTHRHLYPIHFPMRIYAQKKCPRLSLGWEFQIT